MKVPLTLLAGGLFLAVLAGTAPISAADTPAPTGVTWQSAGDSYSSGEGVFGNTGACAQSDKAYGPVAIRKLRDDHGWKIDNTTFTACTDHLVEDFFHARGDGGRKGSLWGWGRDQGGPDRVDVLTMSFGGNDIGFASVISDCVLVPTSFSEVVTGGIIGARAGGAKGAAVGVALSGLTGCDTPQNELESRIDALLDPPNRTGCSSRRRLDEDFSCALALQDRTGSIIDFYYDLVTRQLTDRGRLYVVGYPRIFADTDQWPWWDAAACAGVSRDDTKRLGKLAERLNNKLQEAVDRANQALGSKRVVFVDRFAPFRDGQHELCGRGEDWINGLSVTRGKGITFRKETSFHPNEAGHADTARQLVERINDTFPRNAPRPTDTDTTSPPVDPVRPTTTCPELVDGSWSGTWYSQQLSLGGDVTTTMYLSGNTLSGSIDLSRSVGLPAGDMSGTVSCDEVTFGLIDPIVGDGYQIEFTGTLSDDGRAMSGTYHAFLSPTSPNSSSDNGTYELHKR